MLEENGKKNSDDATNKHSGPGRDGKFGSAGKSSRSKYRQPWDPDLPEYLVASVVNELRQLAAHLLGDRARSHTLQPTAIVNEVWLRMAQRDDRCFATREAFYAFAAKAIRTILVDHARQKSARKRGGSRSRVPLQEALERGCATEGGLLELEDELLLLENAHPLSAAIIEMRFYGGLTDEQIAMRLGIHKRTVGRHARRARLFIQARLHEDQPLEHDA